MKILETLKKYGLAIACGILGGVYGLIGFPLGLVGQYGWPEPVYVLITLFFILPTVTYSTLHNLLVCPNVMAYAEYYSHTCQEGGISVGLIHNVLLWLVLGCLFGCFVRYIINKYSLIIHKLTNAIRVT